MDEAVEWVYLAELTSRCRFALLAFEDFKAALGSLQHGDLPTNEYDVATDRLWLSMQAFLTECANVSKLLWPIGRRGDRSRGIYLRTLLGVSDDSPLFTRGLRDAFEHFDERLDTWSRQSKNRSLALRCIFSSGSVVGLDASDYVGVLDPASATVTILGETYPLHPLAQAADELLAALKMRAPFPATSNALKSQVD